MAFSCKLLGRYIFLGLAAIALLNSISSFEGSLQYGDFTSKRVSKPALESLSLTELQCKAMFPRLTKEIDDAVARGPLDLKKAT
jgi:hypothetical protein